MAAAKKYRVKMRVKVKHRFLKKAGFTLSLCAAAALLLCVGIRAARSVSSVSPGGLFAFKVRSFEVRGPSDPLTAEISRRLSDKKGAAFSSADAGTFAAGLRADYPSLKRVDVKRNFLSGKVSVTAVPEEIVARVKLLQGGGENLYLSANGRLLGENYGPEPETPFETEVGADTGLAPLAGFIRDFKAQASGFLSRPVKLEYPAGAEQERSCRLLLANGASVLWGDFEFTRAKIARLNEVLSDAASRFGGPVSVDLRYFGDGKVFVSKARDI